MSYDAVSSVARLRGRPSKFSPERIQQIRELVKSGASCEKIAASIGVTVGTLKVTCSKLGISLARKRPGSGGDPLPLKAVTRTAAKNTATFAIIMRHNGEERRAELPLTLAMIGQLGLEASSRGLSISELARDLILKVTRKQLVQQVLEVSHKHSEIIRRDAQAATDPIGL